MNIKIQIIKNAIQFLCDQYIINGSIEKKDIISSVNKFMINENNNLDKKIEYIIKTPKKSVIPRSEKQKKYVSALRSSDIIISTGPAGTGKTFLSVAVALTMLLDKKIERIILSRPAVEAGERLGFLPGDMREKMMPWLAPIQDNLEMILGQDKVVFRQFLEQGKIEIEALTYIRGRSINNAYMIIDEAQNLTAHEVKTIITRVGENTKVVLTGDIEQIDNIYTNETSNGLTYAVERFKKYLG